MHKTRKEIALLTKSAKITKDILAVISKRVKPGVSEIEIACEIKNIIRQKGLRCSFGPIVACGANAANPHAKSARRKIKRNDLVVIDFGVVYKGYRSDMTITIIVGKINPTMRKLYKTVKDAQEMAIRRCKPGLRISDFVSGIHNYIRKKGLGKYILHKLGHGVGRRVHEAPKLSEKNNRLLKKNTVLTIEPGLYIKAKSGVRIEDMICLTETGARVLTR